MEDSRTMAEHNLADYVNIYRDSSDRELTLLSLVKADLLIDQLAALSDALAPVLEVFGQLKPMLPMLEKMGAGMNPLQMLAMLGKGLAASPS